MSVFQGWRQALTLCVLRTLRPALPCLQYLLDATGRWGFMDCQRWDTFLDFLAHNGLLTTNIPPRREQVRRLAGWVSVGRAQFCGCWPPGAV